jgi:MFS family permease
MGTASLLAANAVGAVIGPPLEGSNLLPPNARTAILCAAAWAVTIGLFPAAPRYGSAVALLVLAGIFNIAFTSMAQTLVQLLAPPALRGRIVGLFNTAILGLRAGSGLTVGVLGAVIGVQWSLALSAAAVLVIAAPLLAYEGRRATRIIHERANGCRTVAAAPRGAGAVGGSLQSASKSCDRGRATSRLRGSQPRRQDPSVSRVVVHE